MLCLKIKLEEKAYVKRKRLIVLNNLFNSYNYFEIDLMIFQNSGLDFNFKASLLTFSCKDNLFSNCNRFIF